MNFQEILQNFLETVGSYVPGVFGALLILIVGWFIASAIKRLIYNLLKKSKWDEKLMRGNDSGLDTNSFISKLVYYLLMIMVLMVVLEKLGVSQVLSPLENMVGEFMAFIPNLVAAGIIAIIGYFIATVVSQLIGMGGNFLDKPAARLGITNTKSILNIIQKVVFLIIFIPIMITALDALGMDALSVPAKGMLGEFFTAIPKIIAAVLIIGLFYLGGKYFSMLLGDLLKSMGTDNMAAKLQIDRIMGGRSLSGIIAGLAFFYIVFIGVITGVEQLEFDRLSDILNIMLELSGQILFGGFILLIGNFLSTLIFNMLNKGDNLFIANVARYAAMFLFVAIALRSMGIANDIVNLAFGLILGAVAIVIALAYGLGGREAAGEHMKDILSNFRKK